MRRTHVRRSAGFSLVEVTLAVAIIALGLLAVLGLLPQGLNSARTAADNTLVATIVQDVFSMLRSADFTSATLTNLNPSSPPFAPIGPYDLTSFNSTVVGYFDKSGLASSSGSADRYYKVALGFEPDGTLDLTRVIATVAWPALAAYPANTNIYVTMIALH